MPDACHVSLQLETTDFEVHMSTQADLKNTVLSEKAEEELAI